MSLIVISKIVWFDHLKIPQNPGDGPVAFAVDAAFALVTDASSSGENCSKLPITGTY